MGSYTLGISCYYHDSAAALLRDGVLVAAVEEERFTRRKHDNSFPDLAIDYCLTEAGISWTDVDTVGFYEKPLLKFERLLFQHVQMWPFGYKTFGGAIPSWLTEKLRVVPTLRKKGYSGPVFFVPHHVAHAASAFYPSPFERAAIVTLDGVGEWSTATWGRGDGARLTIEEELIFPHSIGLLYSTITAYLGFSVNNSEYKVMGLAAYGNMDRATNPYYRKLQSVIDLKSDGSFRLNMKYFSFHYKDRMASPHLIELLGPPPVTLDGELSDRFRDIAAAVQLICEDVLFGILRHVADRTGEEAVVLAGGVALNSVANGKILKQTPFKKVWIQPNASDGGASLGAALQADIAIRKRSRSFRMDHAYWGPGFSNDVIEQYLKERGVQYKRFTSREDKIHTTARLIHENFVVGWFQGRMEWGPRALGARSILANPCREDAQELLNVKVKHRERFRPFAPVVTVEDAARFFEVGDEVPKMLDFMLGVFPVREEWRGKLPAITHVDNSARPQTVAITQNPDYYDLIKTFGLLSGVPVLINTSFNIRGEPVVCTPHDAYRCMMGTEIDYLVMEDFLISRRDNPQDYWNSEALATD